MIQQRFNNCVPHLPVNSLRETFDYYRNRLGFSNEWIFNERDGGISRDGLSMLFAEDSSFTKDINNEMHRLPLMWFVDNIDEIYNEFRGKTLSCPMNCGPIPMG